MNKSTYKRIMVALDRSEMDYQLMAYSLWLAKALKTEKIYFLHFVKNLIAPKKAYLLDQDDTPLDEMIKADIEQQLKGYAPDDSLEIEVGVQEKHPLEGLLRWQQIKQTDLLIVGKKKRSQGSGVLTKQFVRQADCPVLFVPPNARLAIEKILVPVDFSDNSSLALSYALRLSPYLEIEQITCLHIYFASVHHGKWKVNSQYPKYVYQSAIADSEAFLKQFELGDIPVSPEFVHDEKVNVAHKVQEFAHANRSDLVIIGARGQSRIKLLTLGSTAEKLLLTEMNVPLLVIR